MIKNLCAPDDYSNEKHWKIQYFKEFQSPTMITYLELGIIDGVSVSPVSPWPFPPPDFFFLWGAIKNSVYSNNPRTIDELKVAIT
jgi:hypothetical protein